MAYPAMLLGAGFDSPTLTTVLAIVAAVLTCTTVILVCLGGRQALDARLDARQKRASVRR